MVGSYNRWGRSVYCMRRGCLWLGIKIGGERCVLYEENVDVIS